ncbi:MAG: flagellar hook-associated protein FlgK [Lachnospiraceae bacterium]|nr:flagellar hook-associated protein FlgK [Lachnospiraceae bacterium]
MANGMGSLYIGSSGLRTSQNAMNTTANNLANVDTKGYVRQTVLQQDMQYMVINRNSAISYQQSGLGVSIADVVHLRDEFLDKAYRLEAGRQSFYSACYSTVNEVYTYFQELEGQTFQNSIGELYQAFEEFAKDPSDSVNQNLVTQKASLFISRAQAVYSSLQQYQYNLNAQISQKIDRVNKLGATIYELNNQIMKIEAGGIETAMELRDRRDNALDELAGLVRIDCEEKYDGVVEVSVEGVAFVTRATAYEMGTVADPNTDFITPYWPHMSDTNKNQISEVFNFGVDINSTFNTDVGEIKALVMQRGDYIANYRDVENLSQEEYNSGAGMSVMLSTEAELDQFIHKLVTTINDIFCPNVEYDGADLAGTTADGSAFTITKGMKILDAEKCAVGSDYALPPQELFSRVGTERYTKVFVAETNKEYYVYNEESTEDTSKMYTLKSLRVNADIVENTSHIPHLTQDPNNKHVAYDLGAALSKMWKGNNISLNPNATTPCTFMDYYSQMIGELGTAGTVYYTTSETLCDSTTSIDNQRQQVIGVSSDEELTSMIMYQNAYNAASRYINVVSEMIETLISSMR